MNRFVLTFVFVLFLSLPGLSRNSSPVISKVHNTTHKIHSDSLPGGPSNGGSCSATAVGPHALLTATHCLTASDTIQVDDKEAIVDSIISDPVDHSIYLLSGIEFKEYADVAEGVQLSQGEHFFMFGNPGDLTDIYREGYVAGFNDKDGDDDSAFPDIFRFLPNIFSFNRNKANDKPHRNKPHIILFDFAGFFGDSGSALFDDDGRIVAITSFVHQQASMGYHNQFMGGYELRLTHAQLEEARKH